MAETNSSRKVKCVTQLDPRLECMEYAQKDDRWGIFKGCEGSNYVQQQSNSYSTSGVVWNFNTQSENSIMDRRMYARVQFQCTLVGKAPVGQPLLSSENDAPRAFPLASVTNNLSVVINGKSINTQYNSALQALLRYNLDESCHELDLSGTPNSLDKAQRYQDLVGSVRNPLSTYANNSYETGRGAFNVDSITNPVGVGTGAGDASVTAVVLFTVTEPLIISPMLFKSSDLQAGLIGVRNFGVNFSFSGNLDRVWSHAGGNNVTLSSVTTQIGSGTTAPPQLLVNYLSPPQSDITQIPKKVNYQYYETDTQVNDQNVTLAPNASQSFTNNSIQLARIPKAIYVYASVPQGSKTYLSSDTFFRINSFTLNYLNVSGQFSSMSINDLYNMSVKNGCNMSFQEWSGLTFDYTSSSRYGLTGSVLKIGVSDLHIPSNLASGMNMNSQLSYTIGIQNINQVDSLEVSLTTVLIYEGLMSIENGSMVTNVGVIDQKDVMETRANLSDFIPYSFSQNLYGGNLFENIGHFFTAPYRAYKTGKEAVEKGKQAYKTAMDLKKMIGLGDGGALVGGQQMSRRQLKELMFE